MHVSEFWTLGVWRELASQFSRLGIQCPALVYVCCCVHVLRMLVKWAAFLASVVYVLYVQVTVCYRMRIRLIVLCHDSTLQPTWLLNRLHSNSRAHMCLMPETRELYIEFRLQTHSPKYRGWRLMNWQYRPKWIFAYSPWMYLCKWTVNSLVTTSFNVDRPFLSDLGAIW